MHLTRETSETSVQRAESTKVLMSLILIALPYFKIRLELARGYSELLSLWIDLSLCISVHSHLKAAP